MASLKSITYRENYKGCKHARTLTQKKGLEQLKAFKKCSQYFRENKSDYTPTCRTCGDIGGNLHACLTCASYHCRRKEHLKQHYKETKHELAIDVANNAVYCLVCGEYVYDVDIDRVIINEQRQAALSDLKRSDPSNFRRTAFSEWVPDGTEKAILNQHSKRPRLTEYSSLGLRGLNNLGNTCFMSCVLQAFVHNPPLRNFFLSGSHRKDRCMRRLSGDSKVCLVCELNLIFTQFFKGEIKPYSPHQLLHSVWTHAHHLAGYEQQDAHEFFITFLNGLHLHFQGTSKNCKCIIHRIFTGAIQSDLRCLSCGTVSATIEPFWDISLDLHSTNNYKQAGSSVPQSLIECLERFTHPEKLGSDSKLMCGTCKSLQERSKQLTLLHLPVVVCFHLKRFGSYSNTSTKIKTRIDFPLHLDVGPYLSTDEPSEISNQNVTINGRGKCTHQQGSLSKTRADYSLFSVVNHHGTLHSGHYTSFVRHADQWFRCDDSVITHARVEDVLTSEGYLLFYIKDELEYVEKPELPTG
ncbi:hypothetical protein, variant [Sphaeroforma arctica JP610]|uniref:Ubiquitin carboxyl-terminal hydrolase n=1 Tax=Sphaeroforma arctica JP610 TaxID=667725 RepID=A0A0L0G7D0_9EUKA|nr:hypothetical protein, variant [Sphaeroforma arctica JP610]KNC84947.1 hypothetical protein, variant [Sphaeroforma arctica JP610]|eukprot:XP_014158850.1 hypothetical protein, variant [Sphaeroforma arctica JP610]